MKTYKLFTSFQYTIVDMWIFINKFWKQCDLYFLYAVTTCFHWMIIILWWVMIFVAHIIFSPIPIKWRWVFNGVFIRDNPQSLWEIKGRNYLIDVPFIYTSLSRSTTQKNKTKTCMICDFPVIDFKLVNNISNGEQSIKKTFSWYFRMS